MERHHTFGHIHDHTTPKKPCWFYIVELCKSCRKIPTTNIEMRQEISHDNLWIIGTSQNRSIHVNANAHLTPLPWTLQPHPPTPHCTWYICIAAIRVNDLCRLIVQRTCILSTLSTSNEWIHLGTVGELFLLSGAWQVDKLFPFYRWSKSKPHVRTFGMALS